MSDFDADLANRLERAANLFLCPSIPEPWPDWMTPEKRRSMSEHFKQWAAELRAS
jgi:hypothetical protein